MTINILALEIQEIKQRITIAQVLASYGLKPDKHLWINCPFHEDKTQVCRFVKKHILLIALAPIAPRVAKAWMR